tara:strand:- start:546 stop:1727 length:1182 start_codon:yes stop_codon:yes gene_type:complete
MNDNKLIPYSTQDINKGDIEAVTEVLKSNYLTQGPKVNEFEKLVSNELGVKYALAVNSATSALHLACIAIGLSKGDYLWTTPNTFVASANCGLYCGAKIDFVDICYETGQISIEKLEQKLEISEKVNALPKVLVLVHFSGSTCELDKVSKLSKKYNFKIIEDASHAFGAKYKGSKIGSCEYSDITVFSLHPVKIITSAEGGIATTNNKNIFQKISKLRSHGITKDRECFIDEKGPPWSYEQQLLGYNYRMSELHAALGISQLKRYKNFILKRNLLYKEYLRITENSIFSMLKIPPSSESSIHLGIIRIDDISKEEHIKLFNLMRKDNIGVQVHYIPVHLQPYYKNLGFKKKDFPVAEKHAESSLTLPLYPSLDISIINTVIDRLEYHLYNIKK